MNDWQRRQFDKAKIGRKRRLGLSIDKRMRKHDVRRALAVTRALQGREWALEQANVRRMFEEQCNAPET